MEQPPQFRELTGPIEHWITTYRRDYWGFRPDKEEAWRNTTDEELFLFHASSEKFLDPPRGALTDVNTGIIGVGRVSELSAKDDPVWWEEIHHDGNYPFLVHFSELHWFWRHQRDS